MSDNAKAEKWLLKETSSLYSNNGKLDYKHGDISFDFDNFFRLYCDKFPPEDGEVYDEFFKEKLKEDLIESVEANIKNTVLKMSEIENNLSEYEEKILSDIFVVHNGMGEPTKFYYKKYKGVNSPKTVYTFLSSVDSAALKRIPNNLKTATSKKTRRYRDLEQKYKSTIQELHAKGLLSGKTIYGIKFEKGGDDGVDTLIPLSFDDWLSNRLGVMISDSKFCKSIDIKPLSTDPKTFALSHFDLSKIKEGPTPVFDEWSQIMTEDQRQIFLAWIYGIIDMDNNSRSCLWLMDSGYSGKSAFFQALSNFLDSDGVGIVKSLSKDSFNNNFGFSSVYGARLIIYGDCKNSRLIESEKIHSLLGNDLLSIEFKGMTAFHTKLNAKLLVAGNIAPAINTAFANESSRAIVLKLKKPSKEAMKKFCKTNEHGEIEFYDSEGRKPKFIGGKLANELTPEMPAIFFKAKKCYEELCPNRADYVIPQSVYNDMVDACESPEQQIFDEFITRNIIFEKRGNISRSTVLARFTEQVSKNEFDFSAFKRYLNDKYDIKEKRYENVKFFEGIVLNTTRTIEEAIKEIRETVKGGE